MSRNQRASSVFVISDLHLGGQAPAMMGRPGLLASFIDGLPGRLVDAPGSALELAQQRLVEDLAEANETEPKEG